MSDRTNAPKPQADLRLRAATRLSGAAGAKEAAFRASDALAVLHDLASSPATAADALTLLHELQVHQVELELQAEELRESRTELETALRRQIALYNLQPVGCFTVDRALVLHELNLAGAHMLGIGRGDAYGLPLDSFLAPDSGRTLRQRISDVAQGTAGAAPTLQLIAKDGINRAVRAHIAADPGGQRYLLVLANAGEDRETGPARG